MTDLLPFCTSPAPLLQVAKELQLPVELVELVIRHQWKASASALRRCNSVELSGIGKFTCSPTRIQAGLVRAKGMLGAYQQKAFGSNMCSSTLAARTTACHQLIEQYTKRLPHENRLEGPCAGHL